LESKQGSQKAKNIKEKKASFLQIKGSDINQRKKKFLMEKKAEKQKRKEEEKRKILEHQKKLKDIKQRKKRIFFPSEFQPVAPVLPQEAPEVEIKENFVNDYKKKEREQAIIKQRNEFKEFIALQRRNKNRNDIPIDIVVPNLVGH
jgi:hypothetical protein